MTDLAKVPPHPLAFCPNPGGFIHGDKTVRSGDRIRCLVTGRTGRLDEALHDGDAFVTWDDGSYDTVGWNHLEPATS